MTSDCEKDPPVPADLAGASNRIHRDQVAEEHDPYDRDALSDEPND